MILKDIYGSYKTGSVIVSWNGIHRSPPYSTCSPFPIYAHYLLVGSACHRLTSPSAVAGKRASSSIDVDGGRKGDGSLQQNPNATSI
ncbi:hypothetical protein OPV22_002265 [Ensete ventricosum]|uniref:Uncharacterized protein n=1 Tax=Ensete ventricosum TaxID=4639 RepID=A0AAV8RXD2_ENSVE|nr:hypothetical protein OPV22_002265 [Ensete ventricosum]